MIRPIATLHVLALLFLAAMPALSQANGGMRGQVLDPSGASIPNANVVVTGSTNIMKAAVTDEAGVFLLPGLAAGEYTVRVTAVGFGVMEKKVNVRSGVVTPLDVQLAVALETQQVTVAERTQVDVDPANNASALVLKGEDLNILSDNPGDLGADLQALAGPSSGPNGGQILIDGFSNGQLPPKESIREIRINSNPFSAEYDKSGIGRVEIFTKPGTDKLRGSAMMYYSDNALNARNPYAASKPDARAKQFMGNVGGPLGKKASFTLDAAYGKQEAFGLVNAEVVSASLDSVRLIENVPTPMSFASFSPRVDYALTPTLTLQGRYTVNRNVSENSGVGLLTLGSRGTNTENMNQTAQVSATKVIGTRLINETRFQFNRGRVDITGDASSPSINVLSSFNGGGANLLNNYNLNEGFELQNNSSYVRGRHVMRFGVRVRRAIQDSYSTSGYNGSYTFTSIDSYITTLRGIAQGLPFDQIRALGGGARQYSVTGGIPLTSVALNDASPFIQDDFRVKPNVTISLGLRYEIQSNISNKDAWAPRVGIAWGVGKGQAGGRPPKTVLRLGWGVFYERVGQALTLQTLRQDGVTQQNFVITEPLFYPAAPPVAQLTSSRLPQAIYRMDSEIQAPQLYQSAITLERQLPKNITVATTYTNTRGFHQFRSRNINAPLPGSVTAPGTGVHPYGSNGQLFLYESSAVFRQHQLTLNVNARINPKFSVFGYYGYNRAQSNSDGAGTFPANNYDLSGEFGRAGFDYRHRAQIGGNFTLPFKIMYSPAVNLSSSGPVNITTGTDWNGDTNFNDRPAFATVPADPSKGVIASRWGVFNIDPVRHPEYGNQIIPRNYGSAYGFFGIFSRMTRTWTFGESAAPAARPGGNPTTAPAAPGRYSLQLNLQVGNTLNHNNPGAPIGNMSSPFFGQALQSALMGNANRFVYAGARFGF